MIGKVRDIIELDGEAFALAMIEIPKDEAGKLWARVGKDIVMAWVVEEP
jgi:hypothetical protein